VILRLRACVTSRTHPEPTRLTYPRGLLALLKLAARRLSAELRTEIYEEEWLPEVHYVLGDDEVGPITRLVRATGYALSMWLRRGGARMADGLQARTPPSLQGFEDIRALPRRRRREFGARTARLRELLGYPETFDQDDSARLLFATAAACEAYSNDRDERTAESLAEATRPLAERLGPRHPAVLAVRRAHAHALLQLGRHERAGMLLGELRSSVHARSRGERL
jgi:hypothetical protein